MKLLCALFKLICNVTSNILYFVLDPEIMKKSGRILIVAELAREYGFKDVGGLCFDRILRRNLAPFVVNYVKTSLVGLEYSDSYMKHYFNYM